MSIDKKETKLQEKSTRVKRSRLAKKGKLYIDEKYLEKGFHYRIVNDEPGEVARRKQQGYEVVQSTDTTVGEGVTKSSSQGVVSVTVDRGGTKGILMKMPNDIYKECLDELDEINRDIDSTILLQAGINAKDVYGSVTKEDKL